MGMFNTTGLGGTQIRKEKTLKKLERLQKTVRHEEPDRVPVSDFFWGGFIERWRKELGLSEDANPYYFYDLDWIVTVCNMDPWIRSFETVEETEEEVIVKETAESLVKKWEEQAAQLTTDRWTTAAILEQTMITPSCGTGSLSLELAEKVLSLTSDVSATLRSKYL